MNIADFNIIQNGEVASPLHRLLQEIDIIMQMNYQVLVTNPTMDLNFDRYLFKTGINAEVTANRIQGIIRENISPTKYDVDVKAYFMKGKADRDTLVIDIHVNVGEQLQEQLIYSVVP